MTNTIQIGTGRNLIAITQHITDTVAGSGVQLEALVEEAKKGFEGFGRCRTRSCAS